MDISSSSWTLLLETSESILGDCYRNRDGGGSGGPGWLLEEPSCLYRQEVAQGEELAVVVRATEPREEPAEAWADLS